MAASKITIIFKTEGSDPYIKGVSDLIVGNMVDPVTGIFLLYVGKNPYEWDTNISNVNKFALMANYKYKGTEPTASFMVVIDPTKMPNGDHEVEATLCTFGIGPGNNILRFKSVTVDGKIQPESAYIDECSEVSVLVIVDVEGALANNDLQDNVYLVDNQNYMGSWQEGQCELVTACHDTQKIKWRVVAISPDNDVEIVGFTGQMINNKYCVPTKQGLADDVFWEGTVETQGNTGQYQYSMTLSMDGKQLTFDPFIKVQ